MCSLPTNRQWLSPWKKKYWVRLLRESVSVAKRNAPYRRSEIKGRLWTERSWTTPINSPKTSWKLAPLAKYLRMTRTCNGGVSLMIQSDLLIANSPLNVVGHDIFSSESESSEGKKKFIVEFLYQSGGFYPENFGYFPVFVTVENVQDWADIFVQRLSCVNVKKEWVNIKAV